MEMVGELLLTKEGFDKLENELKYLKTVKRLKIAEQLKEALSYGDIVDNTEYEDAKNNQAFVEGRIITIEKLLYNARPLVIDSDNGHRVALGSTVRLKNLDNNSVSVYRIVSTVESDPFENKISNISPVGKAVFGSEVGDQVRVNAPGGIFYYKIEDIQ
jgi:transcription elongation factor GreA